MSFEELSDRFVESLKSNKSLLRLDEFLVHDFRGQKQGRGLIALKDLEEGEELFSIPRNFVLNILTSSFSDEKKLVLNGLGQWEALILVILYEKSLGDKSKWFHYFNVLPFEDKFNNLMFWEDSELKQLEPSLVLGRIGKQEAVDMYNRLFPDVVSQLGIQDDLKDVDIEQFHRVASTIMSYSFDVEHPQDAESDKEDDDEEEEGWEEDDGEDEEESDEESDQVDVYKEGYYKSMVPLADTLNADTNLCNANLTYTPEFLVMKTTSAIKKGEQIYNTYANHPNAEILRRYGYVEFGGSKHDFGELKFESILKFFIEKYDIQKRLSERIVELITDNEYLLELTEGQNIIIEAYDCYADGEIYPELILLLQIFTVLGVVNKQDKKLMKRMSKVDLDKFLNRNIKKNYQLVEQKKLMKSTFENFQEIISQRIQEYPQDLDEKIKEDYTDRSAMAKCVLICELKSLKKAKDLLLSTFELIDDEKMVKNVLKRQLEEEEDKKDRKRRK